ncbi:amidase domain-containing protein [Rathayibacter sp. VKM Ac-2856]|uniref:amidase domain-containing protein n=1 Tax=unclassified Rathayibacter TaxID=2609250 RepID=UPI001563132B|nr:amidase domain-containing protein [Rathayibacter sp. VKM Ac-2858]NQX19679.1 amidase domain-containing protein [Rathayibacter sp. VKM Ac-2856]
MPHSSTRSTLPAAAEVAPADAELAPPLTRREAREREGRVRATPPAATPAAAAEPAARPAAALAPAALAPAAEGIRPSAPAPLHPAGGDAFPSRRDRRAAEGHRPRTEPARRGSSFFRPSRRHLVLAMSGGLVVVAVATGASLTVGATADAESAAASAAAPTATAAPVTVLPATTVDARVVLSSVSTTSGTVAGGTSVTIAGSNLDSVATVRFGDAEGSVTVDNPDQITVTAPPSNGEAEGVVPVAFFDAGGAPITFDAVTDSVAAATVDGTPAETVQPTVDTTAPAEEPLTATTDAAAPVAGATATPTAESTPAETAPAETAPAQTAAEASPAELVAPTATATPSPAATGVLATTKVVASAITFAYTPDPAIEAAKAAAALEASRLASQLDYLQTYWSDYNSAQYGVIGGNDCVNFTSQSLIARGWEMDGEWSYSRTGGYSSAWASSTAFNSYLAAHPERATPLTNAQRSQVKPGDVVQFDWDGSGDWDHTGVVTSVKGDVVLYSSHTADNLDQSIDSASAGRIMFWSI